MTNDSSTENKIAFNSFSAADVQNIIELTTTLVTAIHASGIDSAVAGFVLALLHKNTVTKPSTTVTMTVPPVKE